MAQKLAETKRFDAIIYLGAVIRGSTPHFDFVAAEAVKGISAVGLKYGLPVIFGVITTNNVEQALERAGIRVGNKGWEAGMAAIEMINAIESIALVDEAITTSAIKTNVEECRP